jgi:hypothetical protein
MCENCHTRYDNQQIGIHPVDRWNMQDPIYIYIFGPCLSHIEAVHIGNIFRIVYLLLASKEFETIRLRIFRMSSVD